MLLRALPLLAGCWLLGRPVLAAAQGSSPHPPLGGGDTVPAALATITTDTGALQPGHRDFSRYTSVFMCWAAVRLERIKAHTAFQHQKGGGARYGDTLGNGIVAPIARACTKRFPLTAGPILPQELPYRLELAVAAQDDPLIQAMLARLVTAVQTPAENAVVMRYLKSERVIDVGGNLAGLDLTNYNWETVPLNDVEAVWRYAYRLYEDYGDEHATQTLLAQVAARGPAGQSDAMMLLGGDLGYFVEDDWRLRDSLPVLRQRALQVLALRQTSPRSYVEFGALWAAEDELVHEAIVDPTVGLDSLRRLVARAQAEVRRQNPKDALDFKPPYGVHTAGELGQMDLDDFSYFLTIPNIVVLSNAGESRNLIGGGPAPRLTADYWARAPGASPSDTVRPVPGKPNLLCDNNEDGLDSLRQWQAEFGPKGLVITDVHPLMGFEMDPIIRYETNHLQFFGDPAKDPAAVAAEAKAWGWYIHVYKQAPVLVALQVKPTLSWRPPPDGRRDSVAYKTPFETGFLRVPHEVDWLEVRLKDGWTYGSGCALVDPQGQIWGRSVNGTSLRYYFTKGPGAANASGGVAPGLAPSSPVPAAPPAQTLPQVSHSPLPAHTP